MINFRSHNDLIDDLNLRVSDLDAAIMAVRVRQNYPDVQDIEDAQEIKVGQVYFVPVVRLGSRSPIPGVFFPVMGEAHDDADFIPVYPENVSHFHIDWRFIPDAVYPELSKIMVEFFGQYWQPGDKNLQLACVIPADLTAGGERRWPLPCQRNQLQWQAVPDWLAHLEAAYKDKRVECNRCPHRGISLAGAPADENGVRVCPGHGLRWSKDGCLVPRTEK